MAALAALVVLACFALAYRVYARFLGERVFDDEERLVTPAHALADGHDFVATPMHLLQGHHFTSIAGAAPIIGPCVAAYWGWAPALAWVVLGTVFMGAAHDFGALVVSARERGRSIADIAGSVIGRRARLLFLCFVIIIVWLVLAVFAMAIAGLFVAQPTSVIPINVEILVAAAVGYWIYRVRGGALWPSLLALAVLYGAVFVGVAVPVDFVSAGVSRSVALRGWMLFLFGYSALASLLPVWLLLQPRDLINSHQLAVGLVLLFAGLLVAHPDFDAPPVRTAGEGAPPIFPVLFVTIACGAISGFHGLVSSGTTSKQLDRLRDARPIGYGSMLGEGTLALLATLAAVAGIGLVDHCTLPGQGAVADLSWGVYYESWAHASANNASAFVLGGGAFLEAIGLPTEVARTLMAVLVISFAATTLDTATRIQRFIFAELGTALSLRPLENAYVGTALAVLPAMALAFAETTDPVSGQSRALGWVLWPIFGASNQLLAALTLMVVALYVHRRGRPTWPLSIPMALVTVIASLALMGDIATFFAQGNTVLAVVALGLLVLLGAMLVLGARAARRGPPEGEA
ncbi:MAG: carbon starvation protein A [Polyangiales bacterium]|nr:carbon starvation protein A [Myxococcales bacterium]MCB9656984.1 carbon starvation protein A [Sandaracinaceae bacterium]